MNTYTPIAAQRHINYAPQAPDTRPATHELDADLAERVDLGEITLRRAHAIQAQRGTESAQ